MNGLNVKKNIVLSTLYQILLLIAPLITTPYISRALNSDGIGIYSYTSSYQVYFSMFAALGTVSYGQREISRNRNNKKKRSRLFWEIELLTMFTSLICIFAWGIFIVLQKQYHIFYVILSLNLINTMLDISWFYSGMEQFKYTVSINSIFKIMGIVLQLIFVNTADDLEKYIFIICFMSLLGTMSMWVFLPKFIDKVPIKTIHIRHHFKETVIYFIPTIATSIYTVLDKTLIGLITHDEKQNGYYEQANKVMNMMKALTFTSLNSVLGSRISFLFAENRFEEIKSKITKSTDYILFMGIGICFGILGIADRFVIWFFGDQYLEVIPILRILSPIIIIIGLSNCLGSQYYTPAGLRKQSAVYIICGSICNLILNLIFIPILSSIGATIASLIAESLITFLYLKNCNKYLELKTIIKLGWKKVLSGILLGFVVFFLGLYLPFNDTITVILQLISGVCIYCVGLLILKDSMMIFFGFVLKERLNSK